MTAVWFNMWPTDNRNRWEPALITDPRVAHYWDADKEIGAWFDEHEEEIGFDFDKGPIVWDSYFMFGPDATWDDFPTSLISYGNTVLAEKEALLEAAETTFGS